MLEQFQSEVPRMNQVDGYKQDNRSSPPPTSYVPKRDNQVGCNNNQWDGYFKEAPLASLDCSITEPISQNTTTTTTTTSFNTPTLDSYYDCDQLSDMVDDSLFEITNFGCLSKSIPFHNMTRNNKTSTSTAQALITTNRDIKRNNIKNDDDDERSIVDPSAAGSIRGPSSLERNHFEESSIKKENKSSIENVADPHKTKLNGLISIPDKTNSIPISISNHHTIEGSDCEETQMEFVVNKKLKLPSNFISNKQSEEVALKFNKRGGSIESEKLEEKKTYKTGPTVKDLTNISSVDINQSQAMPGSSSKDIKEMMNEKKAKRKSKSVKEFTFNLLSYIFRGSKKSKMNDDTNEEELTSKTVTECVKETKLKNQARESKRLNQINLRDSIKVTNQRRQKKARSRNLETLISNDNFTNTTCNYRPTNSSNGSQYKEKQTKSVKFSIPTNDDDHDDYDDDDVIDKNRNSLVKNIPNGGGNSYNLDNRFYCGNDKFDLDIICDDDNVYFKANDVKQMKSSTCQTDTDKNLEDLLAKLDSNLVAKINDEYKLNEAIASPKSILDLVPQQQQQQQNKQTDQQERC